MEKFQSYRAKLARRRKPRAHNWRRKTIYLSLPQRRLALDAQFKQAQPTNRQ